MLIQLNYTSFIPKGKSYEEIMVKYIAKLILGLKTLTFSCSLFRIATVEWSIWLIWHILFFMKEVSKSFIHTKPHTFNSFIRGKETKNVPRLVYEKVCSVRKGRILKMPVLVSLLRCIIKRNSETSFRVFAPVVSSSCLKYLHSSQSLNQTPNWLHARYMGLKHRKADDS